jgi:DNA-binding transcriptional MerR regulator
MMYECRYKLGEFARLLGVHEKTLQKWDRQGVLVAYRTKTNRRYYTHRQYIEYLSGRR